METFGRADLDSVEEELGMKRGKCEDPNMTATLLEDTNNSHDQHCSSELQDLPYTSLQVHDLAADVRARNRLSTHDLLGSHRRAEGARTTLKANTASNRYVGLQTKLQQERRQVQKTRSSGRRQKPTHK